MKTLGFSTILLAFVVIVLLTSAILMGLVIYRLSAAAATVTAPKFWTDNKLYMIAPTVMNVLSMAVLGVLIVMG